MFISPWYRIVPMRFRLASSGALTIAIAAMTLAPASVVGQKSGAATSRKTVTAKTWTPPRTPEGQPDLQGVWLSNSATPLERPKALEGKSFLTDEEVRQLARPARAARSKVRRRAADALDLAEAAVDQNPPGLIQKLSRQVPPGGMLCSSLYCPLCARLIASVMPAIGSTQMKSRSLGAQITTDR